MSFMLFLIWLIGLGYFILIISFYRKLSRSTLSPKSKVSATKKIAVIVAFRNEENHLGALLDSILDQTYPKELVKYIFINDHSKDDGVKILEQFAFENGNIHMEIHHLEENKTGKKAALQRAYQMVDTEIILSTDADCILPERWIELSIKAFEEEGVQMLCGGVKSTAGDNWLEQFQSVELMSLIGSGAAAIEMGTPIMSNGANLAFRSQLLKELNFSSLKSESPSGDDVFLMMEVLRKFGARAIRFQLDAHHWVNTVNLETFEQLVQQRIRWTSKSKSYSNPFLIFVSLLVLLHNFSIPVLFFWSLFSFKILPSLFLYWLVKILIDYFFIKKVSVISEQKFELSAYLNTAIIYPFFISYIAIIGQFTSFKWKGRAYQNL